MKKVITYSLYGPHANADQYYRDIAVFADEVLLYGKDTLPDILRSFKRYAETTGIEQLKSAEQYILELLTLGVLWQVYGKYVYVLSPLQKKVLHTLIGMRKHGKIAKAASDTARGILATLFLLPKNRTQTDICLNRVNLKKLMDWLSASNEFYEEVQILQIWEKFFDTLPLAVFEGTSQAIVKFAQWFEARSEKVIGIYTEHVPTFLETSYGNHSFREDVVFCGRSRVEYHLNMVGAEIMNRDFREAFLKSKEKRLLLPVCMRYNSESRCQARRTKNGDICMHCSAACTVNKLSRMGKEHGFQVLIISHGSSAFREETIRFGEVGIIGVACVLNLIAGGWRARNLHFVPQCVLLNSCGCKKHWHPEGMITSISMNHLKKILDVQELPIGNSQNENR